MDKQVILDYATELQTNDEPWAEFEWLQNSLKWIPCSKTFNPLYCHAEYYEFRRKPKTITVTMPVLFDVPEPDGMYLVLQFKSDADTNTALAAIREAMGNE